MVIDRPAPGMDAQLLPLWNRIFGEYDGFWKMFLETAWSPGRCRCILEDGSITAALCWFDCSCGGQKWAYLYAVMTHPEHRGQGLCRTLIEDTHAHLARLGYDGVLLVPAEASLRDMYRKMGYADCTSVSEFSCTAGKDAIPLHTVSPEEYAEARRQYLPHGGVLQEGENLTFLAAQAELLAGNGVLLAAWREDKTLHVMELLGDQSAAPGIVKALGCEQGEFRTPGKDIPFAMGKKLQEKAIFPIYFGFAFD